MIDEIQKSDFSLPTSSHHYTLYKKMRQYDVCELKISTVVEISDESSFIHSLLHSQI